MFSVCLQVGQGWRNRQYNEPQAANLLSWIQPALSPGFPELMDFCNSQTIAVIFSSPCLPKQEAEPPDLGVYQSLLSSIITETACTERKPKDGAMGRGGRARGRERVKRC